MKRVIVHADAEWEFLDAIDRLNGLRLGLGNDFEAEYLNLEADISARPGIGSPFGNSRYRFRLLRRFSHVIYYIEMRDVIWVMAIAHASRRLGYWRHRRTY